jgi:hypothetical protein
MGFSLKLVWKIISLIHGHHRVFFFLIIINESDRFSLCISRLILHVLKLITM